MTSREQILRKLRNAPQPFGDVAPIETYRHMVPLADTSQTALQARFVDEAERLSCVVWQISEPSAGIQQVLDLIDNDDAISSWAFSRIPLPGLDDALRKRGVRAADPGDASIRVGLTGADAALAATGTLVIASGQDKPRQVSLLPPMHIAVITAGQIMPDLETWMADQRKRGLDHFRQPSNIILVSGPSRTADIGMELIMGAHGPREMHILLLPRP